jgi:hypothetical protein
LYIYTWCQTSAYVHACILKALTGSEVKVTCIYYIKTLHKMLFAINHFESEYGMGLECVSGEMGDIHMKGRGKES